MVTSIPNDFHPQTSDREKWFSAQGVWVHWWSCPSWGRPFAAFRASSSTPQPHCKWGYSPTYTFFSIAYFSPSTSPNHDNEGAEEKTVMCVQAPRRHPRLAAPIMVKLPTLDARNTKNKHCISTCMINKRSKASLMRMPNSGGSIEITVFELNGFLLFAQPPIHSITSAHRKTDQMEKCAFVFIISQ